MSLPYFQFKQFTVWHDKCAMKVGTDGVLLGAWASVGNAERILDIGTGTGLVALMLAQRTTADVAIVALDIDEMGVEQARENVERSPWSGRIEVLHEDFNAFQPAEKFDVIVSNPPYFVDSLASPDVQRNLARHNNSLTYVSLLKGVSEMLADDGSFTIVIPTDVSELVKELAADYALYASRQLFVRTKPGANPKRVLLTFTFHEQECRTEELLVELARHQYSEAYIALTRDYYLKMA